MTATLSSPCEPLTAFSPAIEKHRSDYFKSLKELPKSIESVARAHVEDRILRASPRPLLGELFPHLVVDILHCQPEASRLDVAVNGWLYIYYAVMMLDDAVDRMADRYGERKIIVAPLLFERGLSRLRQLVEIPDVAQDNVLDMAVWRTAEAAIKEVGASRQ